MRKFEYSDKSIKSPMSPEERNKLLNTMGDNGWELVQIMEGSDNWLIKYFYFYFKREING